MKGKIIGILIVTLLIGTVITPSILSTDFKKSSSFGEILDQSQEFSDQCIYIDDYEWQEFVPTLDNLVRVELKIVQWYEDSPNIKLTIEKPLGNVLTQKELPVNALPEDCDWVSFDVPDIDLSPGTKYYIKLTAPIGSEYGWGIAWNNLYPPGESSSPPGDWCFRTYGEEVGNLPPTVAISYPENGDTVNGYITMTGEAHDPDGDEEIQWVKVKIDNGNWLDANGTNYWNFDWDSTKVSDGSHAVSAKAYDGLAESNIASVQFSVRNEVPGKAPDLVVTDVWEDNGFICYQIRNIGNGTASSGTYTALLVDGDPQVYDIVYEDLDPDERYTSCFEYNLDCSTLEVIVTVVADYEEDVLELDEANNEREEIWKCDTTPPKIILGPMAHEITQTSALIYWKTDEDCDSTVKYDSYAGVYSHVEEDSEMVKNHNVKLTGLQPGSTYHFMIKSKDPSGNPVKSKDCTFSTQCQTDNIKPSISLELPENLSGVAAISAKASDNIGINNVIFYCDDKHIFSDCSFPYECEFDTKDLTDGSHVFKTEAYDHAGNIAVESLIGEVQNVFPDDIPLINVAFTNIQTGDKVSGMVYVDVEITHILDSSIKYISFEVDDVVIREINTCDGGFVIDPYTMRFIDWEPVGCAFTPVYVTFMWDANGYEVDSTHNIVVHVQDEAGNWGHNSRYVTIGHPPQIEILRSEPVRHSNYFEIELTIENNGVVDVDNLWINETNAWLQCLKTGKKSYKTDGGSWQPASTFTFDVKSDPLGDLCTISSGNLGTLESNAAIKLTYYAVPVLTLRDEIYTFGETVKLSYRPRGGENILITPRCRWSIYPGEISDAFFDADYLIVTCPDALFDHYHTTHVNELLSTLADFARLKNGVLGYILPSTTNHSLKALISPGGEWYEKLRAYATFDGIIAFELRGSFNYLLLVGETEIVPSFFMGEDWPFGVQELRLTDYPYADIHFNDEISDLKVGRILGDTAEELAIPVQASIDVHNGLAEYDASDALMISGPEDTWEGFVLSIEGTNKGKSSLQGKGVNVMTFHTDFYTTKRRMLADGLRILGTQGHGMLGSGTLPWGYLANRGARWEEDGDPHYLENKYGYTEKQLAAWTLWANSELELIYKNMALDDASFAEHFITNEQLDRAIELAEDLQTIRIGRGGSNYGRSYTYCDTNELAAEASVNTLKNLYINNKNHDLIIFHGHGDPGGWCGTLDEWPGTVTQIEPILFGNSRPIVIALACQSGYYKQLCWGVQKVSIARAFLRNGAAVYIGSTEVSECGINSEVIEDRFWGYWTKNSRIGDAWFDLKNDVIRDGNRFFAYEYNLYGDPKYGENPTTIYESKPSTTKSPSSVEITIPDYIITTMGEQDYVTIPDGELLIEEEGRPKVPYYSKSFVYPKDYRVQDVFLKGRSGLTTTIGLNLPILIQNMSFEPPLEIKGDWYPEPVYSWSIWDNPNGSTTLDITIYPFYYNPKTTQSKFYKNYNFDIEYIQSDTSIMGIYTDKKIYEPGDEITIDMRVKNNGESQDVAVKMMIKKYAADHIIEGFSIKNLENCQDICSYSVIWDSNDIELGTYYVDVTLTDSNGDLLDRKTKMIFFNISTTEVSIESITGGFGVSAIIENIGPVDADYIDWSISLEGDLIIMGGSHEGTIQSLAAGERKTVNTGLILGLGKVTIIVIADDASKTASGFLIGPFVIGIT